MKIKALSVLVPVLAILAVAPVHAGNTPDVLGGYMEVSKALASDSLADAQKAAAQLAEKAKADGQDAMAKHAAALAGSNSIEAARESFKPLSAEAIKQASGKPGYYVMTCGMAKGDWLQTSPELVNPYMGKQMLRCGSLKKATADAQAGSH